ncbi:sulfotransferase family protein [Tateyamaria sp. syn59]|uniref:sulfotransferase family protein n=1 Tax=Tateyamaria sp. syn59 TaxID=2576942 RepID=UPI0011BD46EC|nr:sulfotransferase family protein [Tateyamaria sp. syn59]
MTLKVVNLGLPKTGTTTLARALRRAGMRVADHRIRPRQTENTELHDAFVADLLYRGYFETGDPGFYFDGFDGISEMSLLREGRSLWPQMDFGLIMAIRAHHPGVKFLASNRDPFNLSQSMLAWSDLGTARLPAGNIPGLPEGFGETSIERMQWIEAHYSHLRAIFREDDDFLEYDVADPAARDLIGGFLETPVHWWGRTNVNKLNEVA